MGAGSSAAGASAAGVDPLEPASAPRDVRPPVALRFDGQTADFQLDDRRLYKSIHPVDQSVALALIMRLGTISSAPSVGAGFRNIKKVTAKTPAEAENMARSALAFLVNQQAIRIRSIQVETKRKQGAVLIAVAYTNLKTNPATSNVVRATVNN